MSDSSTEWSSGNSGLVSFLLLWKPLYMLSKWKHANSFWTKSFCLFIHYNRCLIVKPEYGAHSCKTRPQKYFTVNKVVFAFYIQLYIHMNSSVHSLWINSKTHTHTYKYVDNSICDFKRMVGNLRLCLHVCLRLRRVRYATFKNKFYIIPCYAMPAQHSNSLSTASALHKSAAIVITCPIIRLSYGARWILFMLEMLKIQFLYASVALTPHKGAITHTCKYTYICMFVYKM